MQGEFYRAAINPVIIIIVLIVHIVLKKEFTPLCLLKLFNIRSGGWIKREFILFLKELKL